ncbi:hypothetical protein [Actinokineospora inagensis]|uniref:hypothetical protein n=1 Tax=Actinokineospora inagensis TaxID=103730 RepID=UPI0012FC7796|nr:hypothetical protein [Actinokineospora inagensis]
MTTPPEPEQYHPANPLGSDAGDQQAEQPHAGYDGSTERFAEQPQADHEAPAGESDQPQVSPQVQDNRPSRLRRVGSAAGRVARHRVTLPVVALVVGGAIGAGVTAVAMHEGDHAAPAVSQTDHRGAPNGEHDRGGGERGGRPGHR